MIKSLVLLRLDGTQNKTLVATILNKTLVAASLQPLVLCSVCLWAALALCLVSADLCIELHRNLGPVEHQGVHRLAFGPVAVLVLVGVLCLVLSVCIFAALRQQSLVVGMFR